MNLDTLLKDALGLSEDNQLAAPKSAVTQVVRETPESDDLIDFAEVEKLASLLEFIGTQGVENLLEKGAEKIPASTGATPSGSGADVKAPSGTPGPKLPPDGAADGKVKNDGAAGVSGKQAAPVAPAASKAHVASNAAAMNIPANVRQKAVQGDLKAQLKATPFANPTAKQALSAKTTAEQPDINATKTASVSAEQIRAEMARRLQGGS